MTIGSVRSGLPRPAPLSTTGIGSLPGADPERALALAAAVELPYLPQLPARGPAELMIPQALAGMPGLRFDAGGSATIDVEAWAPAADPFDLEIDRALGGHPERFEPDENSASAWRPFLQLVLAQGGPRFAKVQLAGPITARLGLKRDDGHPLSATMKLDRQVGRLVLARAVAMARAIRSRGATPLFFIDEPGLTVLDGRDEAAQAQSLEELRFLVFALKGEGALVGLHCCADVRWGPVLGLGIDILSIDARLSLDSLLATGEPLHRYLGDGGWIALGVVPTSGEIEESPSALVERVLGQIRDQVGDDGLARILGQSLLTPACGLALRTEAEAEQVFRRLAEVRRLLEAARAGR